MKRIARCILQNKEGKIILVRHKGKNIWVMPGGHIENKENIYDAIKREIKEELGISIKIMGKKLGLELKNVKEMPLPITIYKIDYINKKGKKEKRLEYIFLAKIKSDIIKTQIEEIEEYKWFEKCEIEELKNTYEQIKDLVKLI
nr:NUDIX hydrolase [Candidatus Gracilibacteria bacterium]